MDFANILVVIFISTIFFYLIFLLIGVAGIPGNRKAQGLSQKTYK